MDGIMNWLENIGGTAIGIIALAVGLFLIASAIITCGKALGGSNQEWGKACMGLAIGIVGGFLGWFGGNELVEFFRGNGEDIPKS